MFVWWRRPVTAHSHGKDDMGVVGKTGVISVIATKSIEYQDVNPRVSKATICELLKQLLR